MFMILNEYTALKVAEFLLQIKAIVLKPEHPFTWASGWKSPIYCDNRKTLSYPKIRTYIRQELEEIIRGKYGKPDSIAGVATGGIAQGALVAQQLGVPFIYVRSTVKEHGMTNMIEGVYEEGQSVIVIEDLVSTGGSSLKAVKALRDAGMDVKGMLAIFTYGFGVAENNFADAGVELITLSDYDSLIKKATTDNYISQNDVDSLQEWRDNPSVWKQ